MKVFIKNYNEWFDIIKREGNHALIDFKGQRIVFNILGLETKDKEIQQKLF
jgi:hypothetical protein